MGLNSGTNSRLAVIGGILAIAITDSLSDAIAIHVSEEAEGETNHKILWQSTIATFIAKFGFSSMFIIPTLLLPLTSAVIVSIIFGVIALGILCYFIALGEHEKPWKVVIEHLLIAAVVIVATHYTGRWINSVLG